MVQVMSNLTKKVKCVLYTKMFYYKNVYIARRLHTWTSVFCPNPQNCTDIEVQCTILQYLTHSFFVCSDFNGWALKFNNRQ